MNFLRRVTATLASVLGFSAMAADQEVKMVDPKSLLYSLPTIENTLPSLSDNQPLGTTPLALSEDDWRQFEFISASHRDKVRAELDAISTIYEKQSVELKNGWRAFKQLHVRELIPSPISGPISWLELERTLGPRAVLQSAVTFKGAKTAIADGFAVKLGALSFYGLKHGDHVLVLCILVEPSKPGLPANEAKAISEFFSGHGLVLVRWTNMMAIEDETKMAAYFSEK